MLELLKKGGVGLLITFMTLIAAMILLIIFGIASVAGGGLVMLVLNALGAPSLANWIVSGAVGGLAGSLLVGEWFVRDVERKAKMVMAAPAVPLQPPPMGREFFMKGDALVHEERRLVAELDDVRRRRDEYQRTLENPEARKERAQYEQRF